MDKQDIAEQAYNNGYASGVKETATKIQYEATEAAHAIVKGELVVSISKLEEICKRVTEGE